MYTASMPVKSVLQLGATCILLLLAYTAYQAYMVSPSHTGLQINQYGDNTNSKSDVLKAIKSLK